MNRKNCRVYYKNDNRGYSFLLTNKNKPDSCILEKGIIAILDEDDTNKLKPNYNQIMDGFCCLGIFTTLDHVNYLVIVTAAEWISKLIETDIFKIKEVQFIEMSDKPQNENNEKTGIQKFLESGYFYFGKGAKGKTADLSVNIQNRQLGIKSDDAFIWNRHLLTKFKMFEIDCDWYTSIICGSFQVFSMFDGGVNIKVGLISRVNCQRIGTRFIFRGIDDNGYVANFVETEQCLIVDDGSQLASYVQVRGSVPLFWAQPGIQVGSHKIKFTRSIEMSSLAYERHFSRLKAKYGRVEIVNLLGSNDGEQKLSRGFVECHENSNFRDISLVLFDLHKQGGIRSPNIEKLKREIREFVEETHFCWIVDKEMVQRQFGVVRTNCVDCLDRTNAVQTLIGLDLVLERQLAAMVPGATKKLSSTMTVLRAMWKMNGDLVSQLYAGSGALGSGNSRLADAQKSVKRTYQATFSDPKKNATIGALLRPTTVCDEDLYRARQLLPAEVLEQDDRLLTGLLGDCASFVDRRPLTVVVGTWNVNGGKHFLNADDPVRLIGDWLLRHGTGADLFAVGLEEIVDLTASNVVRTKAGPQRQWAGHLLEALCANDEDFMLLSTVQLVGVCLFVLARTALAPHISELSAASVKTGFGGAVGNKGAVAISLQLYETSLCFVCAHFRAGQSAVKDRNEDYRDICRSMRLPPGPGGRTIGCHDLVVWCGDFNYRIDVGLAEARDMVARGQYRDLAAKDQLSCQRAQDKVFEHYDEGPTTFPPTYKYDLFSDDYDTSEKARVPAWTDRVLWRAKAPSAAIDAKDLCRLVAYARAEIRTSDHRPVVAVLDVQLLQVNKKQRSEVIRKHCLNFGPMNATIRVSVNKFSRASEIPSDVLDRIIESFGEVGEILLVRFSGKDLLLNYEKSRSVVDAISTFNERCLKNTDYIVQVDTFDKNWKQNISKMFKEDVTDAVTEYPPLLTELIKNINKRSTIIHEDYFFNEEDDDIKDNYPGPRTRARSCSSSRNEDSQRLGLENPKELGSSCTELSDNTALRTITSKKIPPERPPPIYSTNSKFYTNKDCTDNSIEPSGLRENIEEQPAVVMRHAAAHPRRISGQED